MWSSCESPVKGKLTETSLHILSDTLQMDANHTWISVWGRAVHTGCRQSIPSNNIDICAAVNDTVPSLACGHTNRPFSNRLAYSTRPCPSQYKAFSKSPLRPRKR